LAPRAAPHSTHDGTRGLVLGSVDYGDSDQVVTLFTDTLGRLSALARGVRKSQKRFGGALQPMHTLKLRLDERRTSDLFVLREASIDVPRARVLQSLERLEAAGRALAWVKKASPTHTPEPTTFAALTSVLDRLNDADPIGKPARILGEFALHLLNTLGFGLDFRACVRCNKRPGETQSAMIHPERGGLVCRACGGANKKLGAARRARLAAAGEGQAGVLLDEDTADAIELCERAMAAHVGVDTR
jgi:DNA repair protein RecO (recombination protein O)